MITQNTQHTIEALGWLLVQSKSQPRIQALLTAYIDRVQELEDVAYALYEQLTDWDSCVGAQLDIIGDIVGEERGGRTDAEYLPFVKARIAVNRSNGRIDEILNILELVIGAAADLELREYPTAITVDDHTPHYPAVPGGLSVSTTNPSYMVSNDTWIAWIGDTADDVCLADWHGTIVATLLSGYTISDICIDDEYLYAALQFPESKILRWSLATFVLDELITSIEPIAIVCDDTRIYWIDYTGVTIRSALKSDGSGVTTVCSSGGGYAFKLALDGDYIYWADGDATEIAGHIYKVIKTGGISTTLKSDRVWQFGVCTKITVADGYVYWQEYNPIASKSSIVRCPIGGGIEWEIWDTANGSVYRFDISNGRVYCVEVAGSRIYVMDVDGSDGAELVGSLNDITDITLNGDEYAWTQATATDLVRSSAIAADDPITAATLSDLMMQAKAAGVHGQFFYSVVDEDHTFTFSSVSGVNQVSITQGFADESETDIISGGYWISEV